MRNKYIRVGCKDFNYVEIVFVCLGVESQVKKRLRYYSKQQKVQGVFKPALGVKKAFHNKETEDGKSGSADSPKNLVDEIKLVICKTTRVQAVPYHWQHNACGCVVYQHCKACYQFQEIAV